MLFKESDADYEVRYTVEGGLIWPPGSPKTKFVDATIGHYISIEKANDRLESLKKDMAPILNFLGGTFLLHCRDEEMIKAVLTLKEFVGNK